jgi:tetratricopeptide (TPR) repeat protein
MSRLKRLIVEIHDRSLWQVLLVYVGGSWAVLEAIALFRDEFGLPEWLFPVALILLIVGAITVVALSFVPMEAASAPTVTDSGVAEGERVAPHHRFLTWRTAGFAFVGVLAVWGLVAAGWVVAGGSAFLLTRAAASDIVESRDCIVVAEFENETERAALGLAVREAVVTDIGQSSYVTVLGDAEVREMLGLMRLPDTIRVDQTLALEIAGRDNCPVVVSGTVAPLGTGYILSTRILEASTGEKVVPLSETAVDETEVVPAAQRLSRLVRRHLGESLPSIRRSEPLDRVATGSLEALTLYTLAMRSWQVQGDQRGAIPLLEQAVVLDTTFAEAYRRLSATYRNHGYDSAAVRNADLAYRYRNRLTFQERYRTIAQYHVVRGRSDSAAHYYRVLVDRYPNDPLRGNLGITYYVMGRYEDALQVLRETVEMPGRWPHAAWVLVATAQSLGRHALAESALAILGKYYPPEHHWFALGAADNAYYAGDLVLLDSLAHEMANDARTPVVIGGVHRLAGLASMYGRVNDALALADNAARLGFDANWQDWEWGSYQHIVYSSLAADTPERTLPYLESLNSQLGSVPHMEYWSLGAIALGYALAGEVQSARGHLAVMDSLAEGNGFHPFDYRERALAVIALQEGRAEDAVEHLRRARAGSFGMQRWGNRLLLAEAHAALGHLNEAIAQYDTMTGTYRLRRSDRGASFPLRPLAHERLGSLYLEAGDTVAAARHLAEFIELWKDADPELQPRVESARRLLAQLAAEGT